MELIQTLLAFVVTLGILVTFHEFGHFWVARRAGVKVLRFSVGFGKPLLRWSDRRGTEYVVAAIPLGGYVKMFGEGDEEVSEAERKQAFNAKSPSVRMTIAAAGPLANFLLAILVYWLVFMRGVTGMAPIVDTVDPGSLAERAGLVSGQEIIAVDGHQTPTWEALRLRLIDRLGESGPLTIAAKFPDSDLVYESEVQLDRWLAGDPDPRPVAGLGMTLYTPRIDPVVEQVVEGSAAQRAGMQPGDLIVAADGSEMRAWRHWAAYVRERPGQPITVEVERGGERLQLELVPESKEGEDGKVSGFAGIQVVVPDKLPTEYLRRYEYGVVGAMSAAVDRTWDMTVFTLRSVQKLFTGLISTKNLSGPITIAKFAGTSAEYGLSAWLSFLALLSVSLAVLNLLPIPVLDGGHILFALIETVAGKTITARVQSVANHVGLVFIVCIMVLALYNDVLRL